MYEITRSLDTATPHQYSHTRLKTAYYAYIDMRYQACNLRVSTGQVHGFTDEKIRCCGPEESASREQHSDRIPPVCTTVLSLFLDQAQSTYQNVLILCAIKDAVETHNKGDHPPLLCGGFSQQMKFIRLINCAS